MGKLEKYPPVNEHSNGNPPFPIGHTSTNGGFSIAIVSLPEGKCVTLNVCVFFGVVSDCVRIFHAKNTLCVLLAFGVESENKLFHPKIHSLDEIHKCKMGPPKPTIFVDFIPSSYTYNPFTTHGFS